MEKHETEEPIILDEENIHTTNPGEETDEINARQNFVTGVPGEDESETDSDKKRKGGFTGTLVLTGVLIFCVFAVAI